MITKKEFSKLLIIYSVWLVIVHTTLYLSIGILPPKFGFLGGRIEQYLHNPHVWAFINFDGEHYLSIARHGYKNLQHFYFPGFVLFDNLITAVFSIKEAVSGLIVSRISFFIAIVGLYKLIKIDFDQKIAYRTILILILFPTSFYFASFYTESIFLMLVVWSFYFFRAKKWLWSGITGALSTATRIIGVALFPALLVEAVSQWKDLDFRSKLLAIFSLLLVPVGILMYMYYLWQTTGDPLVFYNKVTIFGQQRSDSLVLLPQVFYRYFFKILPNIDYSYVPLLFVTLLEASVGLGFTVLLIYSMLKLRASYTVYFLGAFIIPTLSGSFSSLPRYVLVIFPAFLLASLILDKIGRVYRTAIYILLFITLMVSASLFFRGYWVA